MAESSEQPTDFTSLRRMTPAPFAELRAEEETIHAGHGILVGSRFYGQVDDVPELFYVATRFFHIWFLPMIPRESWVILHFAREGEACGLQGIPIRLRWKCVLMVWLKVICVMVALVSAVVVAALLMGGQPAWALPPLLVAIGSFGALRLLKYFKNASPNRAAELATLLGLSQERVGELRRKLDRPR